MKLKDKVAIITGAANGIGAVVARGMAAEGAKVVVADVDSVGGEQVCEQIRATAGEAMFVRCDVGSDEDVRILIERTIDAYGQINVLNNNAAVAIGSKVTEMSETDWQKVININLTGAYRTIKHALPHMIRGGGGSIINMSSAQAHVGFHGWTAYAAAKGGLLSMTKQLAVEFAPEHIRVNSVSPGTIRTPMLDQVLRDAEDGEALYKEWVGIHPIGRIGEAEEVANTVVFLASDQASFVTGIDLRVDGGLVIKP